MKTFDPWEVEEGTSRKSDNRFSVFPVMMGNVTLESFNS